MKLLALPSILLGTLLLTSCSGYSAPEAIPQKTFQYSYQIPTRVLTSPDFAKHLSSGKLGSSVKVRLDNNQLSHARLGHSYYSAGGHNCRRYTVLPSYEYAACNVNGKWYQANPIILNKKN